jgi:glycosyltransferase involved in cell wall biosynthesis
VLPADVVIASSGPISVAVPGLVARLLRRRRFVFEVRDLWPQCAIELGVLRNRLLIAIARAFERLCYRTASHVIALSQGSADWIRSEYGFTNVLVVPNACDNRLIGEIAAAPLPQWMLSKKLVLYAGTIGVVNDCVQMVRMCDYLERNGHSEIMMVLIGEGRERQELEELARSLRLLNIRFLGQMARPEMYHWLKAARCSLMLVRNVGVLGNASPNKMFDSLAAGVPVIQNSQGWIRDLLAREDCGITVPPDSP